MGECGKRTHRCKEGQVCAWEDECWVFAAQLECGRRELRRGGLGDAAAYDVAADERDVSEARIARERLGVAGAARHELDEIARRADGVEAPVHALEDLERGPHDVLGALHDDSIASEERRNHRAKHVVHRVVPRHASSDDAQWLVPHCARLVRQEQVARPALGPQDALAMLDRPCEFRACREQLAKRGVNGRLARVAACNARDGLEIALDPRMHRL